MPADFPRRMGWFGGSDGVKQFDGCVRCSNFPHPSVFKVDTKRWWTFEHRPHELRYWVLTLSGWLQRQDMGAHLGSQIVAIIKGLYVKGSITI